ncbi:MAG: PEP-CTERM sorting domain-containing protein [Pseudomonadales bacterium]|nr:PEP-CTERM sorting domain-containing protein [Pseudomonadales bacterium]
MRMRSLTATGGITVILMLIFSMPAQAAIPALDLDQYQHTATHLLPPGDFSQNPATLNAHEVSAVTYNWDNNTLFVVGDEGGNLLEVTLEGEEISKMAIIGFNDPEGLTYVGNGGLVLVEERNRDAYYINYQAGGFLFKNNLTPVDLGGFVDNIGLEGISYDPRDDSFITVKEKLPQEVNLNQLDFNNGTAQTNSLFTPILGVADIADVQVLATVSDYTDSAEADNLLLVSQESSLLMKVDRNGNLLGQFDLSGLSSSAEGVTIDPWGTIYIVAENGSNPTLYVLSPPQEVAEDIPFLPLWGLLVLSGLFGLQGRRGS